MGTLWFSENGGLYNMTTLIFREDEICTSNLQYSKDSSSPFRTLSHPQRVLIE